MIGLHPSVRNNDDAKAISSAYGQAVYLAERKECAIFTILASRHVGSNSVFVRLRVQPCCIAAPAEKDASAGRRRATHAIVVGIERRAERRTRWRSAGQNETSPGRPPPSF